MTGNTSQPVFTPIMPGCFGLCEDHGNPYRFPADRLVEFTARLSIWQALEQGMLVEGTVTEVVFEDHGGRPRPMATVEIRRETPHVWIGDTRVLVTWCSPNSDSCHPFFQCPLCSRRCRFLYLRDLIGCRQCHGLDWRVRHVARQTPWAARVARLRRRLGGCDLRPFAPLPPRRRGRSQAKHDEIVAQIRAEEEQLVAHLAGIAYDLNRRLRRPTRKRRDRTQTPA